MRFQAATITVLLSSIISVQGLSIGGLQDRGLESSNLVRDAAAVDYLEVRSAKQERRRALRQRQTNKAGNKGTGTGTGGNAAAAVTLAANAIQTGSQSTGQGANPDPGQVESAVYEQPSLIRS